MQSFDVFDRNGTWVMGRHVASDESSYESGLGRQDAWSWGKKRRMVLEVVVMVSTYLE